MNRVENALHTDLIRDNATWHLQLPKSVALWHEPLRAAPLTFWKYVTEWNHNSRPKAPWDRIRCQLFCETEPVNGLAQTDFPQILLPLTQTHTRVKVKNRSPICLTAVSDYRKRDVPVTSTCSKTSLQIPMGVPMLPDRTSVNTGATNGQYTDGFVKSPKNTISCHSGGSRNPVYSNGCT